MVWFDYTYESIGDDMNNIIYNLVIIYSLVFFTTLFLEALIILTIGKIKKILFYNKVFHKKKKRRRRSNKNMDFKTYLYIEPFLWEEL
jgi:hypothetical protein